MAGIYIHVPFCKSKCTYCDFASYPKEIGKIESYFACLYREMKGRSLTLTNYKFNSVYFGGGTPSFVKPEYILGAMNQIRKNFDLSPNSEITLEVNPKTIDENKLEVYKKAGINRFSIGLQAGDNKQLSRLNRIHTVEDFLDTCKLLKGYNKSADILIGLNNQTENDLKNTIDIAIKGEVNHISMYALTPEVGTPIYTDYLNGELLSDDEVGNLYDIGVDYLKSKGFNRYEVSNFAKDGFYSRHNMNYWKRGEYIGFGVSASSFIDERRFTNTFNIDEYINAVIINKVPEISSENIDIEDKKFEYIMLALRTSKGLDIQKFNKENQSDFFSEYKKILDKNSEYLENNGRFLRIKDKYLYVQNHILMDFMK